MYLCRNHQDRTALGDGVTRQSESSAKQCGKRDSSDQQPTAVPPPEADRFNQVQSHNSNLPNVGQTVRWWGVLSANIILNWRQHAELKLQVISFLHIKRSNGAKCTKLIRLIDFFCWLSACACPSFGHDIDLCMIITLLYCYDLNNLTAQEHNWSKQAHRSKHASSWLSNSKTCCAANSRVWIIHLLLHQLSHTETHSTSVKWKKHTQAQVEINK